MSRLLLASIIYIISVNRTPVATFGAFRDMNRWTHDYKMHNPQNIELSRGLVEIHKCTTFDTAGQICKMYKSF
jgi:hypothetical protein